MEIERFTIGIPQPVLDDLAARLDATRWPDEIPGAGWEYGTDPAYLRELVDYWRTGYDWRAQERALNEFDHFRATVDGLGVHFIHARGQGPDPFPLIISHGWPGSVVEMLKIIPMLTDPAAHGGEASDSFDVVLPSLPGYGFSDKPVDRGMSNTRIAGMWHALMTEGLDYRRFGAQGGDWGGMISSTAGIRLPPIGGRGAPEPDDRRSDLSRRARPASNGRRAGIYTAGPPLVRGRGRLLPHPAHQAADAGLRPERLPGRAGGLDNREVPHLVRLQRQPGEQLHPRRTAYQHHALLGGTGAPRRRCATTTRTGWTTGASNPASGWKCPAR